MAKYYYSDGTILSNWTKDKLLHRIDGPAIEYDNGHQEWYQNGQLHRLDGPAVKFAFFRNDWYQNGKLHRVGGPAIEYGDGVCEKHWFENGKRHRLDGPAIDKSDYKSWFIEGKQFTREEFERQVLLMKLSGLLDEK